ncbi:MAG: hypothetical protein ACTSVV_14220 [Promethearchaeota archaeon]
MIKLINNVNYAKIWNDTIKFFEEKIIELVLEEVLLGNIKIHAKCFSESDEKVLNHQLNEMYGKLKDFS